jgi:hypothetical protein
MKTDHEYETEFGWIKIELFPDGSTTIHCEDTSFEEIENIIKILKSKELNNG